MSEEEEPQSLIDRLMRNAPPADALTYSKPLDENIIVARPPLAKDPYAPDFVNPTAEEIILRLFYGWMVLRIQTIHDLSGLHRRSIERVLYDFLERGLIKKLGRTKLPMYASDREHLYTLGRRGPAVPPYSFRTPLVCPKANPAIQHAAGIVTHDGILVPAHQYYVSEAAGWLAQELMTKYGFPALPVPEQVLRNVYGWCSLKKDQPHIYFRTPVPDAWFLHGDYRLRLEVQVTRTSAPKVRAICSNLPLNEPVLYIVEEELYSALEPLLDEFPHFFLVRMWNQKDMDKIHERYRCLDAVGGFHPWWMADYYSEPGFSHAVLHPDKADLFDQRHTRPIVHPKNVAPLA